MDPNNEEIPRNRFDQTSSNFTNSENGDGSSDADLEPKNDNHNSFEDVKLNNGNGKKVDFETVHHHAVQKKLSEETYSHLRGRDLLDLNKPKRTQEAKYYYIIFMTAICFVSFY